MDPADIATSFVTIPAGRFLMGSTEGQDDERPVHEVWVDAFNLAVCPVTRALYARFLGETGHPVPRDWADSAFAGPWLPVVGVSWHDAQAFCRWLAGDHPVVYRLPAEAEWERAARDGREGERFAWGDAVPAWVPNGGRGSLDGPWPVTLGEPTGFGLYGIGANVHEWCADWHAHDYYAVSPRENPTGPDHGVRRASRGGSWRHAWTISRSAARSRLDPALRYTDYGFRLVRGAAPSAAGAPPRPDRS
jgi:formylglycine-generating enzyme required for sulfatase activity